MNTNNAGLAPLAIVLIIVVVAIIGGGTYVAVKHNARVKVAEQSASPTVSASVSPTSSPTSTPTATAVPTKKPVVAVAVKFATVQDAVNSGKTTVCVSPWQSEKGPDELRTRFTIKGATVILQYEKKVDGKVMISGDVMTYTPSATNYASILKYGLSTSTCTQ